MALSSFIFTHEVRYQAAPAGPALVEAGSEQGYRDPGEAWVHQSPGCHRRQHEAAVGAGSPGAAAQRISGGQLPVPRHHVLAFTMCQPSRERMKAGTARKMEPYSTFPGLLGCLNTTRRRRACWQPSAGTQCCDPERSGGGGRNPVPRKTYPFSASPYFEESETLVRKGKEKDKYPEAPAA